MTVYSYIAIILTLAIIVSYINQRFIKMQTTIAVMVAALIISVVLTISGKLGFHTIHNHITNMVLKMQFHDLVMNFMLGLLLFAGALTINLSRLRSQKWEIAILAIFSTIASAFIIGSILYVLLRLFNVNINFVYCVLFGSLISPTDPVAVLATFKQFNAPKKLETAVVAESLFNDGVAVVLFMTAYHAAYSGNPVTTWGVILLFAREAVGGIIFGAVFGWILCLLLKPLRDIKLEILLTIILVIGAYTLAQDIVISGPLAMVIAGIFVANYKRHEIVSPLSRQYLETIWEIIDELLNTVLFLLLGFEILIVHYDWRKIVISIIVIALVLITRFVTVAVPMKMLQPWREKIPFTISILTWGGLRGGLAVALALALPEGEVRSWLLALTYAVVLFSIIIQGTTIKYLVKFTNKR